MKKSLVFLLCVTLIFVFSGCTKNEEPVENEETEAYSGVELSSTEKPTLSDYQLILDSTVSEDEKVVQIDSLTADALEMAEDYKTKISDHFISSYNYYPEKYSNVTVDECIEKLDMYCNEYEEDYSRHIDFYNTLSDTRGGKESEKLYCSKCKYICAKAYSEKLRDLYLSVF